MPIQSIIQDYTGENTEDEAVYPLDQIQFTRKYDVIFTDTPSEAGLRTAIALADTRVPRRWEELRGFPWMYVRRRRSDPGNGAFHVIIIIDYVSNDDPVNQDPVYEWTHAVSSEPIDSAIDLNTLERTLPIVNSSSEAYDPPISNDVYDQVLRVTRNQDSFDVIFASNFIGSVNNDWFFDSPPGTVKMKVFDGTQARSVDTIYWQITMEFEFRVDSWDRRVRDEGFRTIDTSKTGELETYEILKDKDGNPLSQPVLLDGSGQQLAVGEVPVFNSFRVDPRRNFSVLGV